MSKSVESQLLGDWSYELSVEDMAKVGGGYPAPWEVDPDNWRVIGQDSYGNDIHQYRFGPYGQVNW